MPAAIPQIKIDTSSNGFKWIAGGALAFGVYWFGVRPIIKKAQAESALKRDQDSTIRPAKGKVLKDLRGRPTTGANLAAIAAAINDALNKFPADEERAIREFQNTPWGYVPQLERLYLDKFGKDLKQDFIDELNDEQWIKIKYNFK